MKTTILCTAAAMLLTIPAPAVFAQDPPPPPPPESAPGTAPASERDVVPASALSGVWTLNPELSDNLLEKMKQAMGGKGGDRNGGGRGGGMSGGMGGGRGGGMGGGGGGGRGGGGRGMGVGNREGGDGNQDSMMARMQERGLRLQKEYSRFEIFLEGPELNITNGLDITQLFFTDGRETNIWTERGEMVAQAAIVDGKVRVQTHGRREGAGRTRTFSLADEGTRLVLEEMRTLPDQDKPVTIRMIYDRTAP